MSTCDQDTFLGLNVPKKATLNRYGMTLGNWKWRVLQQDGKCLVCEKQPGSGRLCIDHEHVKGWKDLPPEQRVLYVRGLVCWTCNHYYLGRGITVRKAQRVVDMLTAYEKTKNA